MNEVNSKLRDSLIILKSVYSEIKHAKDAMMYMWQLQTNEYNSNGSKSENYHHIGTAMYTTLYFTILKYQAFVDEYNRHFLKSGQTKSEEEAIGEIDECQQREGYFKAIEDNFPDLKVARNTILAHAYRDGKHNEKQRVSSKDVERLFNIISIPQTPAMFELFSSITFRIIEVIEGKFGIIDADVLSDIYLDKEYNEEE